MALTLGDNFSYQGAKPLDARLKYATLAEMSAVADATMYDGCMAYCTETDKTYQWKSTNTVDADTGKWREFSSGSTGTTDYTDLENKPSINEVELSGDLSASDLGLATETDLQEKQEQIQYSSMPTASEDLEGAVYQYLGATTSTYTHGHWYECVSDGEDPATYSWEEAPNYEEMDDSDMDDVVTPLPSTQRGYHKYSTEEQVVGEWIDGKKIYEKTIEIANPTNGAILVSNAETLVNSSLLFKRQSGAYFQEQGYYHSTADFVTPYIVINTDTNTIAYYVSQSGGTASTLDWVRAIIQYTKTTD